MRGEGVQEIAKPKAPRNGTGSRSVSRRNGFRAPARDRNAERSDGSAIYLHAEDGGDAGSLLEDPLIRDTIAGCGFAVYGCGDRVALVHGDCADIAQLEALIRTAERVRACLAGALAERPPKQTRPL